MLPLATREVHGHLRNGVAVEIKRPDGRFETVRVRVMDWLNPAANDFVIASQVWIDGPLHRRRPDTIGYVNGLPLLEKLEGLLDAVDWTGGQQTRGAVESAIRLKLNELPEEPYPEGVWQTKVGAVWDFVLRRYG